MSSAGNLSDLEIHLLILLEDLVEYAVNSTLEDDDLPPAAVEAQALLEELKLARP